MKFSTAEPGDEVYNSKLGRGRVVSRQADRLVVRHDSGAGAYYSLDGAGAHGQLHWFSKPSLDKQ